MTLHQTKEFFLNWVNSCKTVEQLRLLESITDEFVVKRFIGTNAPDVIHASAEIGVAIYRQKEKIIINKNAESESCH